MDQTAMRAALQTINDGLTAIMIPLPPAGQQQYAGVVTALAKAFALLDPLPAAPAAPVNPAPSTFVTPPFSAIKHIDGVFSPGSGPRYFTSRLLGGLLSTEAVILRFTAPAAGCPGMNLDVFEEGGANGRTASRTFVLSTTDQMFDPRGAGVLFSDDQDTGISLTLRTDGKARAGEINLSPGAHYFLSVSGYINGALAQPAGTRVDAVFTCNMPRY